MFLDSEILRALYEKSPFGLAVRDTDGGYYSINKKFTEITGYDFSDLIDITYQKIVSSEPGMAENLLISSLASTNPKDWNGEFRYIHKSGKIIIVNQWVEEFQTPQVENTNFFLLYLEDLTHRKQNEILSIQQEKQKAVQTFYNEFYEDIQQKTKGLLNSLNQTKFDLVDSEIQVDSKTVYWSLSNLESKIRNLDRFCKNQSKVALLEKPLEENKTLTSLKDNWNRTFENISLLNRNADLEFFDCMEDEILPLPYADLFQLIWNIYLISIHLSSTNPKPKLVFRRESVDSFQAPGNVWIGNQSESGFLLRIENNGKSVPSPEIWNQLIHGEWKSDHPYLEKLTIILSIILDYNFGFGHLTSDYESNELVLFIPHATNLKVKDENFVEFKNNLIKQSFRNQKAKSALPNFREETKSSVKKAQQIPLEILYILPQDSDVDLYREYITKAGYMPIEEIANSSKEALSIMEQKSFQVIIYKQNQDAEIEWECLNTLREINDHIPIIVHSRNFREIETYQSDKQFQFGFFTDDSLVTLPFILKRDLKQSRSISEKILIDLEAKEQENFYNRIFSSISDILVIFDLETNELRYLNSTVKDVLGFTTDQMNDLDFRTAHLHPEDMDNVMFFFYNLRNAESGKTYRINYRMKDAAGKYLNLENTAQVYEFDQHGKAKKILNSVRDRTDHFKYLELMNQSVQKTRSLSEAKTKFLANISHELKTPLNSILGYSEFLLMPGMSPLSEQQKMYIETIHKDGQYLLNLMNQILDYSKTEMNKFQISKSQVNLNGLLGEIVDSFLIITKKKKIIMLLNQEAEVPNIEIDPIRMREVISNLINNAIKFSDSETRIDIHLTEDLKFYYISIQDQGLGIKPEDQSRIFEPFEQVQNRKSVKNDGIGLGLSLCKKIIELHNGKLTVESKLGIGSIFTISLPRPYRLE